MARQVTDESRAGVLRPASGSGRLWADGADPLNRFGGVEQTDRRRADDRYHRKLNIEDSRTPRAMACAASRHELFKDGQMGLG